MIDRKSRNILAEALRYYVSGQIMNDDLNDIEVSYKDRGVKAVHQMAWRLYDDLKQHHAIGSHAITGEARDDVARWICFLHSDFEYEWPEYNFIQIKNYLMNILTLGWWERRKEKIWNDFTGSGEFAFWPFFSKAQYEHVMKMPVLLND